MKFLLINQESERLKFRKLQNSDFDVWLQLFEDENTKKMLGMSEFKTSKECCEKWFEWTFNRYDNNLGGQNVLISKETDQIIGQCGLLVREVEDDFEIEIAYSILPENQMQGFALESARKCRDYAFENKFHERLISIIIPENLNSKKVAIKNGMKIKRQINFQNKTMDLFEITENEWNKSAL